MSENIKRIEHFLSGKMSAEERLFFEQQMLRDQKLRDEVARVEIIDKALEVAVEDDLRNMLKKLEAGQVSSPAISPVRKTRKLFTRLAFAAGIVLLLSAGLWLMTSRDSYGLEQFSDHYYLGYDYSQIRGEYSQRSDFPSGLSSGNYDREQAAHWFLTWLETHPADDEARYVLADILKEMGQIAKAKSELATIISHQSILWGEKAEWNYVLLSIGDTWDELAGITFQKMITDPAHSYHRQAKELEVLKKK